MWLRITLIIRLFQPQAGDWAWAELGKNTKRKVMEISYISLVITKETLPQATMS